MVIEDIGLGDYDQIGDAVYNYNAPDISFVLQAMIAF